MANRFMSNFEDKYVYSYPHQPMLWKKFIDDTFLICTHGMEKLSSFITYPSDTHHIIKYTNKIPFLTFWSILKVITTNEAIEKANRQAHYLNCHYDHPPSMKKSILYSNFLRMKTLHYESEYLVKDQSLLYYHFIFRQYCPQVIFSTWEDALSPLEKHYWTPLMQVCLIILSC